MAITADMEETSRNAAGAGLSALGVAFLLFAATGMAGAIFQAFDAEGLGGGDIAALLLAGVAALLMLVVGALALRAAGAVREGYGEQPIVKAVIAAGVAFVVLGVLFIVSAATEAILPGSLPLGTLLALAGVLTLVAGNSYLSVSASVAATGAIFGVAAGAVLVSVQVVGGGLVEITDPVAAIAAPALVGIVATVGLIAIAVGALLRAFLWDTGWADVAHGSVHLSVLVLGLGLLIDGASALGALPWDTLADQGVQEVVLLTGLAAGQGLVTVAGFLLLAGAGLGFAAASAGIYERLGLPARTSTAGPRRDEGGTNGASSCPSCGSELPEQSAYCPGCGVELQAPRA